MARQVLPWVGAAVGMAWGNPQLGFAIGSIVANAVDPQVIRGPQLGEGQNNTASEGGYRPIVLGKGAVGVCMIHEGPIKKRTIRTRQSKGGGPVTTDERAYRTMAFALGESADPAQGVVLTRLWIDNKLRYDVTPTTQIAAESAEFAQEFTFYPGNETQLPDPDIEAFMGAGNVPSYRGGAPYIVLPDWDVTQSGGRAPMIKAELATESTVADTDWMLVGFEPSSALKFQTSNGTDWSDVPVNAFGLTPIMTANQTRILLNGSSTLFYTDDLGATFTSVDWGVTSSGGGYKGTWSQERFWIPCGNQGYATSETGISGWTQYNVLAGADTQFLAGTGQLMVMGGTRVGAGEGVNTRISTSFGAPGSWSERFAGLRSRDGSIARTMRCGDGDGSIVVVGGHEHAMAWVSPLGNFTQIASPFTNGTGAPSTQVIVRIKAGFDGKGERLWLAVSSQNDGGVLGQTAYSRNGITWQLIENGQFGADILDMDYGAREFIAVGANGTIKKLTDPDIGWVTQSNAWNSNDTISGIVSLFKPEVAVADKIQLSEIISFIHERVDAERYNVSQLTDMVEGVVFAEGYTGADAIRSAMSVYFFDAGEFDAGSGYRINYVKRGGAAVLTLTEDDIVEGPEDWRREDSYERPRVLHVAYQNPVADYGAPNITIKRTSPDVLVVGERSASVPFVFSDVDEITQRSDVLMTIIYTEIAGSYEVILPLSLLQLAPTNNIGFSIRGRVRRLRMTHWRFDGGTIRTEWMSDRQGAYTSNVTGLPVVPSTPPPPSIVGPTVSAVLDVPAIADSLDTLHALVAHSGQTPAWYGSLHQRQAPSDPDFVNAASFGAAGSVMGTLLDEVTAASQHFTDTTNVIRVRLYRDEELQTFTNQQFLSENGAFALSYFVGGVRHWEIGQYRDAVKVGDRDWELRTLHRGRLNTDAAAHALGSLFVLLDIGVQSIPMQASWLDQDVSHRAVSNGQNPDQAVVSTEAYTGQSQREWPVAHLLGSITSDTLTLTAVPRYRFGTDDHPVRSVNWDGYRFTATDGVNSVSLDSVSATIGFDVAGWSSPITATVAQLNRITGAGPTITEQFE